MKANLRYCASRGLKFKTSWNLTEGIIMEEIGFIRVNHTFLNEDLATWITQIVVIK